MFAQESLHWTWTLLSTCAIRSLFSRQWLNTRRLGWRKRFQFFFSARKVKTQKRVMMENCSNIYDQWKTFMNKSDPRTSQWPLMSSPIPVLMISLIYLFAVKVINFVVKCDKKIDFWIKFSQKGSLTKAHGESKSFRHQASSHDVQLLASQHKFNIFLLCQQARVVQRLQLAVSQWICVQC